MIYSPSSLSSLPLLIFLSLGDALLQAAFRSSWSPMPWFPHLPPLSLGQGDDIVVVIEVMGSVEVVDTRTLEAGALGVRATERE